MESIIQLTKSCLVVLVFLIYSFGSIISHVESKNDALQAPPPNWKEHWYDHNQNLDLVYSDDHVAFYFDSDVNRTTNQKLLAPVSESWQFIKSIYNDTALFWGDTRLFVVLHEQKHVGIRFTTHADKSHDFRNVVECGQNGNNSQCRLGAIIKHVSNLAQDLLGRVEAVESTKLISGWRMLDIMIYDKLLESGRSEAADSLRSYITGKSVDLGQESNYLFRDWYLPIYEGYGGSKIIQRFLGIYDMYEKQAGTGGKSRIPPGALVHLWSEATGTDLRDLAYKAIGWVPDYRSQFLTARKQFPAYTYADVFPNASWYTPPTYWMENWNGHKQNISLTYFDGDVACYMDRSISQSGHWFFQQLSNAWRYVKTAYGPFGQDSVLHAILSRGNRNECRTSKANSYLDKTFDNRIVIDCIQANYDSWKDATHVNLGFIIEEVARVTHSVVKETGFCTECNVSSWAMIDILAYDIYLGMGKKEDAERFKENKRSSSVASPRRKVYWFRDWYYPIYNKFGGKDTLVKFFEQLYSYWPRNGTDYAKSMNLGEFVHFWSGAAGADLTHLLMRTFGWKTKNWDELARARVDYPLLDYSHDQNPPLRWKEHWHLRWKKHYNLRGKEHWHNPEDELSLVYWNDHVAFYGDENVNANMTWAFDFLSESWKYVKEAYGPLRSEDPILYVLLHEGKYTECRTSKIGSFLDRGYDNRNVLDCGLSNLPSWSFENIKIKDKLVMEFGYLILRNVEESGNWQGYRSSRWTMADILAYDIYLGLGLTDDAKRWKKQQWDVTENFPHSNTFWFKDWFYPIYATYGGAKVYKNFIGIIRKVWPQEDPDHDYGGFDLGTMVHFWNGAIGENLWYLAADAFNWGAWNHKKFLKARSDHPGVTYADTYHNSSVTIPPETWQEHWRDHEEGLKLAHLDSHVAIYFDSQMDFSDTWLFEPISDAWRYVNKTYGPFGPDSFLYVVLHDEFYTGCRSSRDGDGGSYIDNEFENLTVLDCGRLYTSWAKADGMDDLVGEMGRVILKGAKKTGNWPSWTVSKWEMEDILAYDIYLGIGKTQEAADFLHKSLEPENIIPKNDIFWLRDWYYPIYAKYGQAKVLDRFLSLLYQHWPKASTGYDYAAHLNEGEFVHFWSGATGANLRNVANKVFRWTAENDKEFESARTKYAAILYSESSHDLTSDDQPLLLKEKWFGHKHHLFQAYADPLVAIYYDAHVDRTIKWPLALLPKVWHQARKIYNTTGSSLGSSLKIILHSKDDSGCTTAWNASYDDHTENIIDCGKDPGRTWISESRQSSNELFKGVVNIIQQSAKQTNLQDTLMSQLMIFDTYLQVGNYKDALQFLNKTIRNEIKSGSDKYWMRDWYLSVYTFYGGTSILNEFLYILSRKWDGESTRKMSTGTLVHFWSAAAGSNLLKLAEDTFGWNRNHPELVQFNEAREEFPGLNYSCYDCHFSESDTLNSSLVAGLAVGVACAVIAATIVPLMVYRLKIRRLENEIRELTNDEIKEFFEGRAGSDQNNDWNNAFIESKPFNQHYEIPRDRLAISIDKVLGSGEFGLVVLGVIKGTTGSGHEITVAVKTVKPNVDITCFKALLSELKVMGYLGMHENIASLIGADTFNIKKREVYIAIEFCSNGDLLTFMKKNRKNFQDLFASETPEYVNDSISITKACETETEELAVTISVSDEEKESTDESTRQFSTLDLLKWSQQISNGMVYISSKKVIHGDLAARNILLTGDNVAKISDFGLSRQLANYSNYMKTSKTPVPWRWMAIESLRDMVFSTQSDAWAFGVTLYEMFSLGKTPYAGWTWDYDFIDKLEAGQRLSMPEFGNQQVFNLMMDCMKKDPLERIPFSELLQKLQVIASKFDTGSSSDSSLNYTVLDRVQ